jgi:hypothetical protein
MKKLASLDDNSIDGFHQSFASLLSIKNEVGDSATDDGQQRTVIADETGILEEGGGNSSEESLPYTTRDQHHSAEEDYGPHPHGEKVVTSTLHSDAAECKPSGTDLLKWVGGSLTVIGAVVGGIALAQSTDWGDSSQGDRARPTRRVHNYSSVVIEELEEDADGNDDWVSIEPTRNAQ